MRAAVDEADTDLLSGALNAPPPLFLFVVREHIFGAKLFFSSLFAGGGGGLEGEGKQWEGGRDGVKPQCFVVCSWRRQSASCHQAFTGGGDSSVWTPTTHPPRASPLTIGRRPFGGGSRRGKGGGAWGAFEGAAPPNSWVCGPSVIQRFQPPLAPIESGVSLAWVFRATLGTSGGWAEAVMGLE